MNLLKRYCMLEAIRTATIDETTIRLVVNCGTEQVVLEPADTDEDTRCIQVTIRCEENSKEGAITDEEESTYNKCSLVSKSLRSYTGLLCG